MDETYTEASGHVTTSSKRSPVREGRVEYYAAAPPDTRVEESRFIWKRNRFDVSVLTMTLISAVTFFMPLLNGLLAGTFGGFHAGRPRRALAAALVAAVLVPASFFVAYNVFSVGSERLFYGLGWVNWTILNAIGLFIGALCGASSRPMFSGEITPGYAYPSGISGAPLLTQGDVAPALPEGSRDLSRDLPTTQVSPPSGAGREE